MATQNWDHKIPMVLARGLCGVADNGDADIFKRDDVWQVVDSTFRKYLELHPRSATFRTYYLKAAYLGNHRDVAQEQYKILGDKYDFMVLSDEHYKAISDSLGH